MRGFGDVDAVDPGLHHLARLTESQILGNVALAHSGGISGQRMIRVRIVLRPGLLRRQAAVQQLRNKLPGGGAGEVLSLRILQRTQLLRSLFHTTGPVGTLECAILVVAHRAQDHRQCLIARDRVAGSEAPVAVALDQSCIGAVADVAGVPRCASHIVKAGCSIRSGLCVGHVGGSDAVDDCCGLRPGNAVPWPERPILIAAKDAFLAQSLHGRRIGRVDFGIIGKGARTDCHDAQQHRQRQQQRRAPFDSCFHAHFLLAAFFSLRLS